MITDLLYDLISFAFFHHIGFDNGHSDGLIDRLCMVTNVYNKKTLSYKFLIIKVLRMLGALGDPKFLTRSLKLHVFPCFCIHDVIHRLSIALWIMDTDAWRHGYMQ